MSRRVTRSGGSYFSLKIVIGLLDGLRAGIFVSRSSKAMDEITYIYIKAFHAYFKMNIKVYRAKIKVLN